MKHSPQENEIEVFELDTPGVILPGELVRKVVKEVDHALTRGAGMVCALWRAQDASPVVRGMPPKQLALLLFPVEGKYTAATINDFAAATTKGPASVLCAFAFNSADLVIHVLMATATVIGDRLLVAHYRSPPDGAIPSSAQQAAPGLFWSQMPPRPTADPSGKPLQ